MGATNQPETSRRPVPQRAAPDGDAGPELLQQFAAIYLGPGVKFPLAGAWAADVAAKLLADHGMTASDVDLVVANPLEREFLDALAAGLGVSPQSLVAAPANRQRVHTAPLGVALEPVIGRSEHAGKTTLLVSAGAGPIAGAALLRQ